MLEPEKENKMEDERMEMLDEDTNFFEWQSKILKVLRLKGVQDVITGDIHNRRMNEKAALLIIKNVSPKFTSNLQSCKTAKEMMLKLESHFCYKNVFEKFHIKKQLLNLNSEPFENLQSHFHKFDVLMSKLKALSCEMGETEQVFHLLFSLLDRYDSLISSLDKSCRNAFWENSFTLDCIKATLLDYEAALMMELSAENDVNYSLLDCDEKNVIELSGDLTQQLHDQNYVSNEAGQFPEQKSNDNLKQLQNSYDNSYKDRSESDIIPNEILSVVPEQIQIEDIDACSLDERVLEDNGSGDIFKSKVCETEPESMCLLQASKLECQKVLNSQVLLRDIAKDLQCLERKQWFLTPMQLTHHTKTHNISLTLPHSGPSNHNTNLNYRKSLRREAKIPLCIELGSAKSFIGTSASTMEELPTDAYPESEQVSSVSLASGQQTVPLIDVSISDLESVSSLTTATDSIYNITPVRSTQTISSKGQITMSSEKSVVLFDEEANLDEDIVDDYTEPLIYDDEENVDNIVVNTAVSDLVDENDDDHNARTKLNSCSSMIDLSDNTLKEPNPFETVLLIDNNTEEIVIDPVKNELESQCVLEAAEIDCRKDFSCELKLRDIAHDLLCSLCNKWFLTTQELKIHKLTHLQSQNCLPSISRSPKRSYSYSISSSISKKVPFSLDSSTDGLTSPLNITDVPTDEDFEFESNAKKQSAPKIGSKQNGHSKYSQNSTNIKSNLTCNICQIVLSCKKSLAQHLNTHRNILKLSLSKASSHSKASNVPDYESCNKVSDKTPTSTSTDESQSSKELGKSNMSVKNQKTEMLTKTINVCNKSNKSDSGQLLMTTFLNKSRETTAELRSPKVTQSIEKPVTPVLEVVDARSEHIDIQFPTVIDLSESPDLPAAESGRSEREHQCNYCKKAFKMIINLNTHIGNCHIERPYYCHICRKPFNRKDLEKHLKTHDDIRVDGQELSAEASTTEITDSLPVYTTFNAFNENEIENVRGVCDICGRNFGSRFHASRLRVHRDSHTGFKLYACVCGKRYAHEDTLNIHLIHAHTLEKPYACEVCGMKFAVNKFYQKHKLTHTKIYPCKLCLKTYKTNYALKHHVMSKHEKRFPFVCFVCGKGYTNKQYLVNHHSTVHKEKSCICPICGKSVSAVGFKHHCNQHNKEKVKRFECDICSYKTVTKSLLSQHMSKHMPVKPYKCNVCKKRFRLKKYLDRHKHMHAKDGPKYSCSGCGQRFFHIHTWRRHMRTPHSDRTPRLKVTLKE